MKTVPHQIFIYINALIRHYFGIVARKSDLFSFLNNFKDINCGHVRKCVMLSVIIWTINICIRFGSKLYRQIVGIEIIDSRISFYYNNLDLLPPKPKFTFRNLKKGVKEFHRKFLLAPADKAANNHDNVVIA